MNCELKFTITQKIKEQNLKKNTHQKKIGDSDNKIPTL